MAHALSAADVDLLALVLSENLFLVGGDLMCNVLGEEVGHYKPLYLGKIGAAQAHSPGQDAVLDASSASDVPSSASS